MLPVFICITRQHDLSLVALAACICAIACFTTLSLLSRSQAAERGQDLGWLLAAAVVFGCGVWSLHFVSMLAFLPGVPIAYDVRGTILSVVVPIAGACLALLAWRSELARPVRTGLAGVLIGSAISAMHYCGVAAMRLSGGLRFDHQEVAASIAVSIVFATLAFARSARLGSLWRRIEASAWLAVSICGLHFTGMTALTIDLTGQPQSETGAVLGSGPLAVAVGSVSLAILLVTLAATLMEQHLSQRAVLELKRMQLLSDVSHEGVIIHRAGTIQQVNAAGARLFGISVEQLIGGALSDLLLDAHQLSLLADAHCTPQDARPKEIQVRNAGGKAIPVEFACTAIEYEGRAATVVSLRDLSDRKRDEARIRHLAHHDALTDLPNRSLLHERLARALTTASRARAPLAVLYLDLDRFKPVNDLLGHATGDALLVQVAGRLRAAVRPGDDLARIGGDEFVIVTKADSPEKVAIVAGRVIDALAQPFQIDTHQIEIGTSIGIALYPRDSDSMEGLDAGRGYGPVQR